MGSKQHGIIQRSRVARRGTGEPAAAAGEPEDEEGEGEAEGEGCAEDDGEEGGEGVCWGGVSRAGGFWRGVVDGEF